MRALQNELNALLTTNTTGGPDSGQDTPLLFQPPQLSPLVHPISFQDSWGHIWPTSGFGSFLVQQWKLSWPLVRRAFCCLASNTSTTKQKLSPMQTSQSTETPMTKQEYVWRHLESTGSFLAAWANILLGILISLSSFAIMAIMVRQSLSTIDDQQNQDNSRYLLQSPLAVSLLFFQQAVAWKLQQLRLLLAWLAQNPLGIKVNAPLAQILTACGTEYLNRLDHLWSMGLDRIVSLLRIDNSATIMLEGMVVFLVFPATLGLSGVVALYYDLWRLVTWPIQVMADILHLLFVQIELYILEATWRLFRGKKRNVLRQDRTDTLTYDSTQLFLGGSILFAIALFLGSTFFIYYAVLKSLKWVTIDGPHFIFQHLWCSLEGRLSSRVKHCGQNDDILCGTGIPSGLSRSVGIWYFQYWVGKKWFPKGVYLQLLDDHRRERGGPSVDVARLQTRNHF